MNNLALEQCEKLEVIFPRVVLSYRIIAVAIVAVAVIVLIVALLGTAVIVMVVQLSIFIPASRSPTSNPTPQHSFRFTFWTNSVSLPFSVLHPAPQPYFRRSLLLLEHFLAFFGFRLVIYVHKVLLADREQLGPVPSNFSEIRSDTPQHQQPPGFFELGGYNAENKFREKCISRCVKYKFKYFAISILVDDSMAPLLGFFDSPWCGGVPVGWYLPRVMMERFAWSEVEKWHSRLVFYGFRF